MEYAYGGQLWRRLVVRLGVWGKPRQRDDKGFPLGWLSHSSNEHTRWRSMRGGRLWCDLVRLESRIPTWVKTGAGRAECFCTSFSCSRPCSPCQYLTTVQAVRLNMVTSLCCVRSFVVCVVLRKVKLVAHVCMFVFIRSRPYSRLALNFHLKNVLWCYLLNI